ncbi:MAG: D-alanyl-D-alanine carboxypeptidase family protein [Gammaproteobacteria bacterium]|jgi:D-alanyl-D-alanine carboxypeptidase (penicillin-binding protein 5/6)
MLTLLFGALWNIGCLAISFPGIPAPPKLDVGSYALVDFATGTTIAEFNADERAEPASITKIMTAYVAAEALASGAIALDDVTTVSEKAWRMEGSRMFIEVDKQITVNELLQGIVIQSGNDASVALAEYVSGSESVFASVMNQHAARLGMTNTSFANSTGLPDPATFSTARDLSKLAAGFIRDYPNEYRRFAEKEFTYAGIRQHNRNRLLARDPSVDGFKTGHTEAAGYCLVSSALRGDMRLVAVVMGAGSDSARTKASQALLNYGFRFFESRRIYVPGDTVATRKVWKGKQESVNLTVAEPLFVTIPRGKYDTVVASAEIAETLKAPIEKHAVVGQLVFKFDDTVIANAPLVAADAVAAGSIFSRAIDEVMMLLE